MSRWRSTSGASRRGRWTTRVPGGLGGGTRGDGLFCGLNLDGFVYERFGHLPSRRGQRHRDRAVGAGPLGRCTRAAAIARPGRSDWRAGWCMPSGRMCGSASTGCSASRAGAASSIRSRTGIWRRCCGRRGTTGGTRGRDREQWAMPSGQPHHAAAAADLGRLLRLRPVAGPRDRDRGGAAGDRDRRRLVGLEAGRGAGDQLLLRDDRGDRGAGVPARCPRAGHGGRAAAVATTTSSRCSTPWT